MMSNLGGGGGRVDSFKTCTEGEDDLGDDEFEECFGEVIPEEEAEGDSSSKANSLLSSEIHQQYQQQMVNAQYEGQSSHHEFPRI